MSFYDVRDSFQRPIARAVTLAGGNARPPVASGAGNGVTTSPPLPTLDTEDDGTGGTKRVAMWDFDNWDDPNAVWGP